MRSYEDFLASKATLPKADGLARDAQPELCPALYGWQRELVSWALWRGRAAIFADCGLGKTLMQLSWASALHKVCGVDVLILTPLAVAAQTVREAHRFGIEGVLQVRAQRDVKPGISVANYEMLHKLDASHFGAVVLDESSILKNHTGKVRQAITDSFESTPYKLCCTATPSPNDFMELGTHAEFIGVCTRAEMLATYFVHDGGRTSQWRLKGHAREPFWQWMASWSVMVRTPEDVGAPRDARYDLPELRCHQHTIRCSKPAPGMLFVVEASSLTERRAARKASIDARCAKAAELVNTSTAPWIVWCGLNAESSLCASLIPGAVEVTGSDDVDVKRARLEAFSDGDARVIVTKPTIAGFGLNWQHCANQVFVGLSDSFEQYYQAIRRSYRFGQERPVDVHIVTADNEGAVVENIKRKQKDMETMASEMVDAMRDLQTDTVHGIDVEIIDGEVSRGDGWTIHHNDCVEVLRGLDGESIDYSVFSPPFESLYTYTNSDRDMGNCADSDTFAEHFAFAVREIFRVLKPGRLVSFHCMNLPTSKSRDGVIGIRDFRGQMIRLFEDAGFVFHSEVCIWKDPVTAMQRTKALGLLWKQLRKDSAMSRQGIPDYLVTMRKDGTNEAPISHTRDGFPVDVWQRYASPVWMDINPSRTLQYRSAREHEDERHICPLQLDVIERCLELWSNPGDLVLSPFAGIGSEGHCAISMGRRFVGAELKGSYYRQAVANLRAAAVSASQPTLFDAMGAA